MLKELFTSNTRIKLLSLFLFNPDKEYFIRQLTRELDEQINSIRRELDNLKKIGLLRSRTKNKKKYFAVNKNFLLFNELRAMFKKVGKTHTEVVKKITKLGNVSFLLFSGQFVDKDGSVDLLIVGEIDKDILEEYLDSYETKSPIRFSILSQDEFLYRIKCNDKFIKDLVESPENIIGINKIQKLLQAS